MIEIGKSGTEGIETAEAKAPSIVGINILQKVISSIGIKHNRGELKKLIDQLYTFKKDPGKVREELIKSGIEIFQNFESQFVQVTADGNWERAMEKLAHDAVNRIINYFKKNTEEGFSTSLITKGIISGESKKYKHTSTDAPHSKPGHTLKGKNLNSWNTAELFDKAGLVTIKSDGTADKYYKKKGEKSDTSKYGYRLLFKWESEDLNVEYQEVKPTREEYKYILKPDEKLKNVLLSEINSQDPKLVEERLVGNFQEEIEQMKQNAEENFNELESYIDRNFSELSSYIKKNQNEIKEIFSEVVRHHQEASQERQEIAHSVEEGRKENREGFKQTDQKLNKIYAVMVGQESKQVRRPIWFSIRESVQSFTGRQEQLDKIATAIKQGIVVISGLGGVGKSELAIRYARSQYNQEDSVIWIDAETAKESFHRLYKKLGFKIKDEDGEEKNVKSIVEDVYGYFADRKSLFIFDNAERYTAIEKFLPLDLPNNAKKPCVLVTSPNSVEWKSTRINIETLSLGDFTDIEAMAFVKDVLGVKNDLQNEDIANLAKKLHNFPLALQQAVAYIKDTNEAYQKRNLEFEVSDYLKKYEETPKKLLNVKVPTGMHAETIFKTLEVTFDKVKNEEYGQQSLNMLNIISYFASSNIPEKMFLSELASGDQGKLISITSLLEKYSIVRLEQGMLSVHGLVQQVRRLELVEQKEEGRVLEEETLAKALRLLKEHMKDCNSVEHYTSHVTSAWNYASKYDKLIESFIVNDIEDKAAYTTYFHLIAEGSGYEVVEDIINKVGQNYSNKLKEVINVKDKGRGMPLHNAALSGDERIVKLLIEKGANVNVKKEHSWTPLHLAAKNGYLGVVKVLLDNKAKVSDKTGYKFTSLHLAARNGYSEIVKLLLDKGADVNAQDKHKYTPLHFAVKNNHFEVVQALLEGDKINVNAETEYRLTPLHFAAREGYIDTTKVLLEKGADVNIKDTGSFTPLHLAALNNHIEVVNDLLKKSEIDVNAQTTKGNTPLHLAAEKGNLEVVKALIARNANVDVKNEEGKVASDLAHEKNHLEVKNYIIQNLDKEEVLISQVEQPKFNKRQGTSGISGQLYEIELSMLFLLQGVTRKEDKKIDSFYLATNMKEAGDFDDVVFKHECKGQSGIEKSKVIFFQAKHKDNPENEREKVTIDRLFSESNKKEAFSLKDYFSSYRKIKNQFSEKKVGGPIFGSKFEDCDFIIYTNALPHRDFNENDKNIKKINVEQESILNLGKNDHYYKLILGGDKKVDEKIIDVLQYSSDCKKLARELVKSIFPNEKQKSAEIVNQGIVKDYHVSLAEKVIEKKKLKEGTFSKSFVDGDESLSLQDRKFRDAFFEEIQKKKEFLKKSIDELKSELRDKNIKLPDNFGDAGENDLKLPLPSDLVNEDEIKEFFSKLKLFVDQPNEGQLGEIIKQKIQSTYKVEQQDIDSVFSDVEYRVRNWWKEGDEYLTEKNKFFQESARVSINFDVKDPVTLFTGRREELSDLHSRIQRSSEKVTVISQMTSISGLGGIGKTELSRQYIYENSEDYDNNIIWINAESEATLIESFSRLAKDKLKIYTKDANGKEKDIKSIVEEVYKFFNKRKSLFIFDDAEKNDDLSKFLPLRSLKPDDNKPYVLITSRNREWGRIEVLDLNELKLEDAIGFVKKGLSIPQDDKSQDKGIESLVEKLQRFPLAIQQAIAYIEDQRVVEEFRISDYLKKYEEKTKDLLNSDIFKDIDNDYAKTTFTTWKITIDKVASNEQYGKLALKVLDTMAYFASENINREIFLNLADGNEEQLRSAVRLLVKYSMVNGKQKQSVLSVHKLVQEVTRLELKERNKEREVLKDALTLLKKPMGEESDLGSKYIFHAVSAWGYVSKHEGLVKEFSELPAKITGKLDGTGRYKEAYLFGIEALNVLDNTLKLDHHDTLFLKSNIALALNNQGKYDEALRIYQEVDKKRLILNSNHSDILSTRSNIAWVLDNQGKYDEALKIYQEIYERRREALGPEHPDTLKVQDNIALVLHNQGQYKKSLQIYQDIYEKFKRILGPSDLSTLKIGNNMALVLEKYGKLDQALQVYQEVYEKRKETLGEGHPLTLLTKNNIAVVLGKQGKPEEEILKILQEVYDGQRCLLGINHPDTLLTMSNIGISLGLVGKYDEALRILKDVYMTRKGMLGENHAATLSTKHSIAVVLHRYGKYDEALNTYQEVYDAQKRVLGVLHPYTLLTKNNMMEILVMQGKYEQALKIYQEVYEQRKENLGNDHYDTLTTRNDMAKVLEKQGKYDDALKIFQEVYNKRKEVLGLDHPDTLATQNSIEILENKQGKNAEVFSAEECLPSTSHRKRRNAENECLFTWEDVDEFNLEKGEKKDFSKIKIDSGKFVSYVKDLPEGKRSQLIQLADKVKVTGESQSLVNKLVGNQKVISHLNRVGKVSGIAMHGMMAKNVLADFLNGDYQGVAINVGFIASGQGFAKVAEAASFKGLKLVSEGKLLLGRSLKAASPFLARGTSAFVIYDLVNQVKAFKNGTEEALVGIIGDSIYLGVDAAEIGIEIAEAFEVLEGVSSITGPIGATIGAVVFVGTDIYMAVKRVDKIDQIIHLKGSEKFIEGLRAFIGMEPEKHIEELIEEKQLNNQLVKQGLEYLQQHSDIQRYVFPTGKSVVDSCNKVQQSKRVCVSPGFNGCTRARTVTSYTEKCTTKFEEDLDNTVLLDRRRTDIKWSRAKPDNPRGGQLFCLPQGNYEPVPNYGSYLCKSAIGITDLSTNKTGGYTLINLGEGTDHAKGFIDSPNIFVVNNGSKKYHGGNKDDIFILQGSSITGYFYGEGGVNTLDLTSFAPEKESIDVKLHVGQVEDYYQDNSFGMSGINRFLGRKGKADRMFITCDSSTSDIKFVDGQGSSERFVDHIKIDDKDCAYEMQIVVRPNTVVYNRALKGDFHYIVPYALGNAKIDFIYTAGALNLSNTFAFEYEPAQIKNVDVRNMNVLNKTSHIITFNFSPMSGKEFNITISGASNPSYRLGNNTEIKVGNRGNLYMLENTNKSVNEIIKDYLVVANRLNKMSFFIQSLLSNETVAIGSGNYEVIHNNPLQKSHLVGNGGENVYVINSENKRFEIPLPEVVIYDLDVESSVDTVDLRNLVQQTKGEFSNSFKLQILKSANDLLLKATVEKSIEDSSISEKHEYFTVRLKDGVNWYNKTHVIMDNVPMKINLDNNEWSLKPLPLVFEKDKEVIIVTSQDVEENTELITPKKAGNYTFVRDHGSDLIITNAFNTQDDLCTIVLSKFYETPKMKTLSIKFADKEIVLKDKQKEINTARYVDVVKREHKEQVYSDVFNHTKSSPEVIMLSGQPVTHRHEHHIRNRRSENTISSGTRTSSWINDLFGWVKSSVGGLFYSRAALPEETSSTTSSISQVDAKMDINGTIMLFDLLIRKVTGQKYISTVDQSIPLLEARGYALNITNRFEKVLNKTAIKSGISVTNLNFDPVAVQSAIIGKIINGRFSEIAKTLYSFAKEACPEFKQTDKFLDHLRSNLKEEKETVMLQQKVEKPYKDLSQEVSRKVELSKKPDTFLNGTSVVRGISRGIN